MTPRKGSQLVALFCYFRLRDAGGIVKSVTFFWSRFSKGQILTPLALLALTSYKSRPQDMAHLEYPIGIIAVLSQMDETYALYSDERGEGIGGGIRDCVCPTKRIRDYLEPSCIQPLGHRFSHIEVQSMEINAGLMVQVFGKDEPNGFGLFGGMNRAMQRTTKGTTC
jgi:hypothetical protein